MRSNLIKVYRGRGMMRCESENLLEKLVRRHLGLAVGVREVPPDVDGDLPLEHAASVTKARREESGTQIF